MNAPLIAHYPYYPGITHRELATILAALRYWQTAASDDGSEDPRELMPFHFEEHEPLVFDEIDELCERLNFGE